MSNRGKKEDDVVYILVKQNQGGVMPEKPYPESKAISSEDYVYIDGEQKYIAYAVGESSCFPENWRQKNPKLGEAPSFVKGQLTVPYTNKGLIEFLDYNNRSESNEDKVGNTQTVYKRLNIKKDIEDMMAIEKRKKVASDLYWETVEKGSAKAVARRLGLYGDGKAYQIKLHHYSENNHEEFIELIQDAQEMSHAMRLDSMHDANEAGFIVYNQGRWFWKNGGDSIIAVPKGADRHDYITGWTFADTEGSIFWNSLSKMLKGVDDEDALSKPIVLDAKEKVAIDKYFKNKTEDAFDELKKVKLIKWVIGAKSFIYEDLKGIEVPLGFTKDEVFELLSAGNDVKLTDEIKGRLVLLRKTEVN